MRWLAFPKMALGLTLAGGAAIPAVDSRRHQLAETAGRHDGRIPAQSRARLRRLARPRSTGGKPILGRISKRGSKYLRTLFIQAANVILMRPQNWERFSFGAWLANAVGRMHRNKLATALANKLARIVLRMNGSIPDVPLRLNAAHAEVLLEQRREPGRHLAQETRRARRAGGRGARPEPRPKSGQIAA